MRGLKILSEILKKYPNEQKNIYLKRFKTPNYGNTK